MDQNTISKITYSLGTNFDNQILDEINQFDQEKRITSLFGKMNSDIFGGGRASSVLPELSFKELENYVAACQRNNINFNYLLNPICTDNREFLKKEHKKIVTFLEKLSEINISHVTVNSPYLCTLIRNRFPHMKITLGLYAGVYSLQLIKNWEDLGVSEITLVHEMNRRFSLLEDFLKYTKKTGTKLRLIANSSCLHNCPNIFYHSASLSHASLGKKQAGETKFDFSLLDCTYLKIKNPAKFISSVWIRPEDIKYYEDVCERAGNYNLDIKLLERINTTEFLKKVIKAYISRSYDGNLLDLLNWFGTNVENEKYLSSMRNRDNSNYDNEQFAKYIELLNFPSIFVDNKKLDGFIDYFVKSNTCVCQVCNDDGFANDTGTDCSY